MNTEINAVKEFWDRKPCNINHSKSIINSIEYFNEVEERKYFVEPHIPNFADFPKWNGKKVLEVGCGIGTDAVNFVRNGADYFGIELSGESLAITKKRFSVFQLKGELIQANIENFDELGDINDAAPFDLIYSFGVLHHTPDITKALNNLRNFANPHTEIKLMLYAKNSWKQKMIEAGLDQPEAQNGCPIANVYEKEEIQKLLSQSGFQITKFSQDHIFPYVVEDYKNFSYVLQPWFEAMPDNIFNILEKSFGWHMLVDAKISNI
jgi:SAM-dependent methyltransferase